MVTVQFYLPTFDNTGVSFDHDHDNEFLETLVAVFNGATTLPGLTQGRWLFNGKVYSDECRILSVSVEGILAQSADILATVEFAKSHYRQEKIFVQYLGIAEIL